MIMIKNLRIKKESWDDDEGVYIKFNKSGITYTVNSEKEYKKIQKGTRIELYTARESGFVCGYVGSFIKD